VAEINGKISDRQKHTQGNQLKCDIGQLEGGGQGNRRFGRVSE
jgi:hypothetical protein